MKKHSGWLGGVVTIAVLGVLVGACGGREEGQRSNPEVETVVTISASRMGEQCVYTQTGGPDSVELRLYNPEQDPGKPGDEVARIPITKGERVIGLAPVSSVAETAFMFPVGEINGSKVYCNWPDVARLDGKLLGCTSFAGETGSVEMRCR